jgi:hypothetical protein
MPLFILISKIFKSEDTCARGECLRCLHDQNNLTPIPMGWKGTLRAMEAAQRRQQRDAQKRQRELDMLRFSVPDAPETDANNEDA